MGPTTRHDVGEHRTGLPITSARGWSATGWLGAVELEEMRSFSGGP